MTPNQTSTQYLLWVVDVETNFPSPLLYFLIALIFCVSVLFVPSSVFPFFIYTDKWLFSPNSHTFSPVFLFFFIFLFILRNFISRLDVLPIFPFISITYQEPILCNFF